MQNGNREPDKIAKVTIELKDVKTADHDEAEQAHKVATLKRALSDQRSILRTSIVRVGSKSRRA